MNLSGSECSSGCESGWTVYFDQVSNNEYNNNDDDNCSWGNWERGKLGFSKEEEEDLSMVSDASSGPPPMHFQEYENSCHYYEQPKYMSCNHYNNNTRNDYDIKNMMNKKQQQLNLEDTATSPFFHFSMENVGNDNDDTVGNTYGFPPPQIEDDSISKKKKGFFKSSKKGKQGSLLGRKRQ